MKKETIIAVILGIGFGLAVAFFMITKTKQSDLQSKKAISVDNKVSPTGSAPNKVGQALVVTSPKDNAVVSTDKIKIQGKTSRDALVVIQSPADDLVFTEKTDQFSVDFPLTLGENVIRVSVYPKDKTLPEQQKELRVYYLDEQ
ncbi:hypothetical protein M1523_01065 [Patescibacteria group bacterium]|nr:hypothetical protein [Patescibacteria group bacterium]MCL5091747.1 hypothetical protein [Patescibacteria group bacterium]